MKSVFSRVLPLVLVAVASGQFAFGQTIDRQFRRIKVDAMARDAIFNEDDVIVSDVDSTRAAGVYQEVVSVTASTITGVTTAFSSQESEINVAANSYEARGVAETTSVEDGASSNNAESLFRFDFTLSGPGSLNVDEVELEAVRANINDDPRDDEFERSDRATLIVRVIDRSNGNRVFNKVVRLRENEETAYFIDSFDVALPAGSYRLITLARVNGDDALNTVQGQPRGSVASYNIEGNVVQNPPLPEFSSIKQRISGSFVGSDPYGDDPLSDSLTIESTEFDAFNDNLDLSQSSTTTIANQSSDVDLNTGVFYAYGAAASGLYVQGDASSNAESCFETEFTLSAGGDVLIDGEIGVSSFLGSFVSQDEPGSASVILQIVDATTGDELFDESVFMNGSIPSGIRQSQISETVTLPAGSYKLFVTATSSDIAIYEQVAGSIAVGYFELEGLISSN